MKRILSLLTLLALASAIPAMAQWRYGFNLGGSFAKARTGDTPSLFAENRSGFRGGLSAEYELPRCGVAFGASLLYQRYSFGVDDTAGNRFYPCRDYLEIPLDIKYKWWLRCARRMVAPMVMTGPTLMVGLDSRGTSPGDIETRRALPGWNVGAGIDLAGHMQLTAGYRFALSDAATTVAEHGTHLRTDGWWLSALLLFDF